MPSRSATASTRTTSRCSSPSPTSRIRSAGSTTRRASSRRRATDDGDPAAALPAAPRPAQPEGDDMTKKKSIALIGTAIAAVGAAAGLAVAHGPSGAKASSHREAPLISEDPTADNTDLYAWRADVPQP